ncbi:hypothetical protein [Xanthomonas hortorum]|uniref:hypothetical protein n=1 Tax=Xanthomonas hortorum TaxID=56454 RepID=UPI0029358972|nr:hypothetical protein [Xanthomonas hortorum]MDV2453617.1 hypothetical protein [Xanthomonas hortorum NBC5720]
MMKRSRSLTALLSLALVAMLPSACARPSEGIPPAAVKSQAAQATTNLVNNKTDGISVQELERRLLRFVDAFKVPADMSNTRLESTLGINLGPPMDPAHPWYMMKDIPLAGGYTLYATHFQMKKGFSRMQVSVRLPDGSDPTRKPAAVCIWDAATLSKKLEDMGYKGKGKMPFQGGWIRQHWRSINEGNQGFSVALLLYQTDTESGSRECALGVQIDGGDA